MTFIALRGATAWECQIGRLWLALSFPQFWLFSRTRHAFFRERRAAGLTCKCHRCRSWLFYWPGFIRITEVNDD